MLPARAPILTPSALLMRRRRSLPALRNDERSWYFAALGLAGTPWADVSRTGLGTRVDSAGLVGFGPHNLAAPATDFTNANYQKILGVTVGAGGAVTFPGAANAERIDFNSGIAVSTQAVWSATFRLRGSGVIRIALAGSSGGEIETLITLTGTDTDYTVTGNAAAVASGNMVARLIRRSSEPAPTGLVWSSLQFNAGPPQALVPNATTAARYLPRITHDPVTLSALGLLVEGQATNLLGQTDNLAGSGWTRFNNEVPLAAAAFRGRSTWTLQNTSGGTGFIVYTATLSADGQYSALIHLFAGTSPLVRVGLFNTSTSWVGLTTTKVSGPGVLSGGVNAPADISSLSATEPTTLRLTATRSGGAGNLQFFIYVGGGSPAAGNTCRVQVENVEAGSVATSYIPNPGTGSAVRAADDWFLSGAAFTAAIDTASSNTLVVHFRWYGADPVGGVFAINDGTSSNRIEFRAGQQYFAANVAGVNRDFGGQGAPIIGLNKVAISWGPSGAVACLNGGTVVSNANSFAMAGLSRLYLGMITGAVFQLNGQIDRAHTYRGQYITGAALQALTA